MVPTYAPTRWEIAIEKQGLKFRVCYSARKTQSALRDALFAIPLARRLEIFDECQDGRQFRMGQQGERISCGRWLPTAFHWRNRTRH